MLLYLSGMAACLQASQRHVDKHGRFGVRGVMVWAGIFHGHKAPLVLCEHSLTVIRYRDTIFAPNVVPSVQHHDLIFQQDDARCHAAICRKFLEANNVNVLPWPAFSVQKIYGMSSTGVSGDAFRPTFRLSNFARHCAKSQQTHRFNDQACEGSYQRAWGSHKLLKLAWSISTCGYPCCKKLFC